MPDETLTSSLCGVLLTLASLSRFVIADLTDPRSVQQELMAIIPQLQSVPICPLLLGHQHEWAMFCDLARRVQVIEPISLHQRCNAAELPGVPGHRTCRTESARIRGEVITACPVLSRGGRTWRFEEA